MTLKAIKPGNRVKVISIGGQGAVKRRIMEMGITKGAELFIRKVAPLGDPIEVTVRGYELSIRKDDAELIEVGLFNDGVIMADSAANGKGGEK